MKLILITSIALLGVSSVCGQQVKDSCCITKQELVGVWQRDIKKVGNGLDENFHFFEDGSFILNFTNENEDVRGIIAIKGTYRLVRDQIYLTTLSRTVVDGGQIVPTGSNETYHIFIIRGGEVKEIKETHPKEAPIYITLHPGDCIELSNETYYKVSNEDLKSIGIDPKGH